MGVRKVVPKLANVGRIERAVLLHDAQAWLETAPDRGCGPHHYKLTLHRTRYPSRSYHVCEHTEASTCPRLHMDAERALSYMKAVRYRSSSILILRVCRDSRICMFLPLTRMPIILKGAPTVNQIGMGLKISCAPFLESRL
jgi:hypothetical protein